MPTQVKAEHNSIKINRVDNHFTCYFQDILLLTLDFEPDESVIQHIGFITIKLHSGNHSIEVQQGLRKILTNLLEEGRVKKLELFTSNPAIAELCRNTGFFVRAEKIASIYENGKYHNELGVEYSFFEIADAQKLIKAKVLDLDKRAVINEALISCKNTIESLEKEKINGVLGARFLENLTYQMVRDNLGPNKIFSLANKRWMPLLLEVPKTLQDGLLRLANRLVSSSPVFFQANQSITFAKSKDSALDFKKQS
ncbi:MAG: hypothetical protein H0U70_08085 [Tatlockia sp.]|nr:hypothetical protein [Tatlockia sp.]